MVSDTNFTQPVVAIFTTAETGLGSLSPTVLKALTLKQYSSPGCSPDDTWYEVLAHSPVSFFHLPGSESLLTSNT